MTGRHGVVGAGAPTIWPWRRRSDDARRRGSGGTAGHWAPGAQILWRYRENGGDARIHIARPVTVVRDDPELLAVMDGARYECVKPVLADGTPVHREPLGTGTPKPRTVGRGRLAGHRRAEAWPGPAILVGVLFSGSRAAVQELVRETWRSRWPAGRAGWTPRITSWTSPCAADRKLVLAGRGRVRAARRDGLVDSALAGRVREAGRPR
ncbi:hypothetical protein GCM10023238_05360 [Streptomyces heliomycini]